MQAYVNLVKEGKDDPWNYFEVFKTGKWRTMRRTDWFTDKRYRYQPKQDIIVINGFAITKPQTIAPELYSDYFVPDTAERTKKYHQKLYWSGSDLDYRFLQEGVLHLTEKDAIKHAKALISITKFALNEIELPEED